MKPVIYCITNAVSANFVANALLAVGASPVMSDALEEVEDLCQTADALLINIGTPSQAQFQTMLAAGRRMHELGKPVVLDPVGANTTHYRLEMAQQLIRECRPAVIRGNASEIAALAGNRVLGTGLDSTPNAAPCSLYPMADSLAGQTSAVIVVSGPEDYITDGTKTASVTLGSPAMALTTGTGCVASALIAAYIALHIPNITSSPPADSPAGVFLSAVSAMTAVGKAGMDMPRFLERLCTFA